MIWGYPHFRKPPITNIDLKNDQDSYSGWHGKEGPHVQTSSYEKNYDSLVYILRSSNMAVDAESRIFAAIFPFKPPFMGYFPVVPRSIFPWFPRPGLSAVAGWIDGFPRGALGQVLEACHPGGFFGEVLHEWDGFMGFHRISMGVLWEDSQKIDPPEPLT